VKAVSHPKEDNITLLIAGIEDRLRIGGTKAIAKCKCKCKIKTISQESCK